MQMLTRNKWKCKCTHYDLLFKNI